ncbi:hypothetical protein LCGC14_2729400, partial [marine sediment metagenome]
WKLLDNLVQLEKKDLSFIFVQVKL